MAWAQVHVFMGRACVALAAAYALPGDAEMCSDALKAGSGGMETRGNPTFARPQREGPKV